MLNMEIESLRIVIKSCKQTLSRRRRHKGSLSRKVLLRPLNRETVSSRKKRVEICKRDKTQSKVKQSP